jgi:ABC-type branched-subunit amino acid transport system substrate-binding protein
MSKRLFALLSVLMLASMLLAACGTKTPAPVTEAPATDVPATEAPATEPPASAVPEICSTDAIGCAIIEPGQTIKIGMGAPMTGDNAAFGQDISQAAMIAISDAGQFQGFSFELVAEDDGGSAEGGAAVANKLVSDPQVVAIAGHIFSGATAAAMPIYETAGIPMMSPSATNPPLTSSGSTVFNRCVFTDAAQGKFAAAYLFNKLAIKNLAIVHDGQAYGQGLAEVVQTEFTALGGTVVASRPLPLVRQTTAPRWLILPPRTRKPSSSAVTRVRQLSLSTR